MNLISGLSHDYAGLVNESSTKLREDRCSFVILQLISKAKTFICTYIILSKI